jgi:hypothetical protein
MPEKRVIPLTGKWMPSLDGVQIGINFKQMVNMCYTDAGVRGIAGMTLVHSNVMDAAYLKARSAFHYSKSQPAESHVVVQAWNTGLTASQILDNKAVIPASAEWEATEIHSDASGAITGRFSNAPGETLAYCNSKENLIWGGDEAPVDGFIVFDPDNNNLKYDYTERVQNTLTTTTQIATMNVTGGGIDDGTLTKVILHFENNFNDDSGNTLNFTNSAVIFSTSVKKFGTYAGYFNGSACLISADNAAFDCTGGVWTVDMQEYCLSLGASRYLWSQYTDADTYIYLYVNTAGAVILSIHDTTEQVNVTTANGVISANMWHHIEVTENGDDYYIFVDGVQQGYTNSANRPLDYTNNMYIGACYNGVSAGYWYGCIDEFRLSVGVARHVTAFTPMTTAYSTLSACNLYILSTVPIKGIKPYIKTANTSASTVSGTVWVGSWDNLTSISDGTDSGGVSLAQTGWITFDDTKDTARVKMINNNLAYAYKFVFSGIDGTTTISYCTRSGSIQPIRDIWDGNDRPILAFYKYSGSPATYADCTLNVFNNEYDSADAATFVELDNLVASTEFLIFGWGEKISGITIGVLPGHANATASTVASIYYTKDGGVTWSTVGTIDDGTSVTNISFAQSGTISWNMPSNAEDNVSAISRSTPLYHYKVVFSQTLSADVQIYYVAGIPQQKEFGTYKFPLMANESLLLCCNTSGKKHSFIMSAAETNCFFNGDEFAEIEVGETGELVGGAYLYQQYGSNVYNLTILFKQNEMWKFTGVYPDWQRHCVSDTIGLGAPKTLLTINLPADIPSGLNRSVMIWQGTEGIYISDGRTPIPVHDDIACYFDRNRTECIKVSMIGDSVAWLDLVNRRYHIKIASGSTATGLNTELVFDYKRWRWFKINRGTGNDIVCGVSVKDTYGNTYPYGFIDTGYMLRTDYGTSFNGTDIQCILEFGDFMFTDDPLTVTSADKMVLTMVAHTVNANNLTYDHYVDTYSTARKTVTTIDPNKADYRISKIFTPITGLTDEAIGIYHSGKFTISTDNELIPFEPLGLMYLYTPKYELQA